MAWELIFMLVLLKIPLFYLCGVVWYAIKAEPLVDEAPDEPVGVREPLSPRSWPGAHGRRARRNPSRRPSGSRGSLVRMEARR